MNHSPFGDVSLHSSSNDLMYKGIMINDKKECFEIHFYPDLNQIIVIVNVIM